MNKKYFLRLTIITSLAFIVLIALLFTACTQKPKATVTKATSKAYYTCSMHPQVHEDHPDNCPICAMKLIKVEMTGNGHGHE